MFGCCCTLRLTELCLPASTFCRGGILSENKKDGKVTVHSAKNMKKFESIVGIHAASTDQMNIGVAAALRYSIYGGVARATSLSTTVAGGPDADDRAYVEFKVDGMVLSHLPLLLPCTPCWVTLGATPAT